MADDDDICPTHTNNSTMCWIYSIMLSVAHLAHTINAIRLPSTTHVRHSSSVKRNKIEKKWFSERVPLPTGIYSYFVFVTSLFYFFSSSCFRIVYACIFGEKVFENVFVCERWLAEASSTIMVGQVYHKHINT